MYSSESGHTQPLLLIYIYIYIPSNALSAPYPFQVFYEAIEHNTDIHRFYHLNRQIYPLVMYCRDMDIQIIIFNMVQHPKVVAHLGGVEPKVRQFELKYQPQPYLERQYFVFEFIHAQRCSMNEPISEQLKNKYYKDFFSLFF